jgi:hypothetical protein
LLHVKGRGAETVDQNSNAAPAAVKSAQPLTTRGKLQMKPKNVIMLAALLAVFLLTQAIAQSSTPAAPAEKDAPRACCNHDKAEGAAAMDCCKGAKDAKSCCKDGKCEGHDCCAKMASGKDHEGCCGKDAKSCPMMAKGHKGCCSGDSCARHGGKKAGK